MKIALHDNSLSVRGTTVALYDYAHYLSLDGHDCIIIYNKNHPENDENVIKNKFKKYKIYSYDNSSEIDNILLNEKCEYFFAIKGGKEDGVTSSICKNLIMAVSSDISISDIHGDKYFVCSPFLSRITGIDFVPHMVNLPEVDGDLRDELNIPKDATVFGRNGGYDTFDLQFVKDVIREILNIRDDYYFLFQNTEVFINHPRVLFIDSTPDLNFKVRFINTCDAHLHARRIGESFGLTCGEFSIKNKPVITWNGSFERNHIEILGDKALLYNNHNDLINLLLTFDKNKSNDWNCYKEYLPENVMSKFKKMYFD
jgi:glycosyltransferase involved in cell wall biosynthesis